MPAPVFGVASVESGWPFPDDTVSITRGGSDNFALGGGTLGSTGQTATYGGAAATLAGTRPSISSQFASLYTLNSPASGAQNWVISGTSGAYGPAVMTFSGVDIAGTPVRDYTSLTSASSAAVTLTFPSITADEIVAAYVSFTFGSGTITLTATGATTIRAQGANGSGFGGALMTSTSNTITFTRSAYCELMAAGVIVTGTSGGGGPSAGARAAYARDFLLIRG